MFRLFTTLRKPLIKFNRLKYFEPPKMPNSWECCGDDCPNCVWTTYFEELEKYNKIRKQLRVKNPVSIMR